MTYLALLNLVVQYAPEAEKLIEHLVVNVAAGRSQTKVTDADGAELDRLGALTAEAIFARRGVALPP